MENALRYPRVDLKGKRFGRLLVEEFAGRDPKSNALWRCACDCGTVKVIAGSKLTTPKTPVRSCGCLHTLPQGEGALNKLLVSYKRDARKRGLSFSLSRENFKSLTSDRCYYCGRPPQQITGEPCNNGYYFYNGIDRIQNEYGYEADNVVPCCKTCNSMKSSMSRSIFLVHINLIVNYQREVNNARK